MKLIAALLLLTVTVPTVHATLPTVVTQLASNETTGSFYLRGTVNPQGSNTLTWFEWGSTTALGSGPISNLNIGAGTTNVFIDAKLTNLLAGTRYYFKVCASNATSGVVCGATDNAVTTQVSYEFTGSGIEAILGLPGRPFGSEPGSVWDDTQRLDWFCLESFVLAEHNANGTHQNGFLRTAYIQDGAVTLDKLDPAALSAISSQAVSSVIITNALVYISNFETNYLAVQTTTTEKSLGTATIASNSFRFIKVSGIVYLSDAIGGQPGWNLDIQVAGVSMRPRGPFGATSSKIQFEVPMSVKVTGGQTADTLVDFRARSANTTAKQQITATLHDVWLEGIP